MNLIIREKPNSFSLFVGVFIIFISNLPLMSASENKGLNYWSIQCYKSKTNSDCMTALAYLESLQRESFVRNNYRCQSYLLGIGSDIILIALTSNRSKSFLSSLQSFKKYCE
tara:strand:- start:224 stop:559 length:336 start_codon:yes stop_codon:yes gene_type:complete